MKSQILFKMILASCLLTFSAESTLASIEHKSSIKILTPRYIKRLLGAYPAKGSVEEAQDFEILLKFQESRTEEECALAAREKKATLKSLFAGENGPLTKKEALLLTPLMLKFYAESGINIYIAKKTFKRARPYLANSAIRPCVGLEKSYAYPSGHTTLARVFARILSRVYPSRSEAFMKRSDEVARNRILGGVHHPSDIEAGNKLGDVLANSVVNSKEFTTELEKL
jgi:acid phosphatase (class A)